jgi:hypothetical protein
MRAEGYLIYLPSFLCFLDIDNVDMLIVLRKTINEEVYHRLITVIRIKGKEGNMRSFKDSLSLNSQYFIGVRF